MVIQIDTWENAKIEKNTSANEKDMDDWYKYSSSEKNNHDFSD